MKYGSERRRGPAKLNGGVECCATRAAEVPDRVRGAPLDAELRVRVRPADAELAAEPEMEPVESTTEPPREQVILRG